MLISKNMATFWKRIFLWNIFSSELIMIMYTTNQKFGFGNPIYLPIYLIQTILQLVIFWNVL